MSTAIVPSEVGQSIIAVGSVHSHLPSEEELMAIKKLASHTKAIGVILPPPEVRAIVDKTANFVAKHGADFEKRILEKEKNNSKFNFLYPTSPYHAYYKMRIKELGEVDAASKDQAAPGVPPPPPQAPTPAPSNVQVIPLALAKLEKPSDPIYTVPIPDGLTYLDLDVIKTTAQFVARNGKNFLTGLTRREASNPQYSFLKPTHSLFTFFTSLCDAYSRVLMPPKRNKDNISKDASDISLILERCLKRLEWDRVKEREQNEADIEAEKEREVLMAIDWHDFVIVETIGFIDDEDTDLPPPVALKDVVAMNKARDYIQAQGKGKGDTAAAMAAAVAAAAQELGIAPPPPPSQAMDEDEREMINQGQLASTRIGFSSAPDVYNDTFTAPPPSVIQVNTLLSDEGAIKVVRNYQRPDPKAATARLANGQVYDPTRFAVSPVTGELVAVEDMAEHMRVSLIDPRWKEQKEAMMSKLRDSAKANDDEIARNLMGLARTRPDIFGSTDEEVTQVVAESIREKLLSGSNRLTTWDGSEEPPSEGLIRSIKESQQAQHEHYPNYGSSFTRAPIGPNLSAPYQPPLAPPPPGRGPHPPPFPPPLGTTVQRPMYPPPPGYMAGPPPPSLGQMPPPPPPPHTQGGGMGRDRAPLMVGEEPEAKRTARGGDVSASKLVLEAEDDFLAKHPGLRVVRVQCPVVEGNDKLVGQVLEVEVVTLEDTILVLKERLSGVIGVAANKQRIARDGCGFTRDEYSLAFYNVGAEVVLQMTLKERAGKKK